MFPLKNANLNAEFLEEQVNATRKAIESSGGTDNPWLTDDGLFVTVFDFVYIQKSIRNNWMSKKLGQLEFEDEGVIKIESGLHLVNLYKLEATSIEIV